MRQPSASSKDKNSVGKHSPPSTPTSEVRGKEKSSKIDKSTNEVQKPAGPPVPKQGSFQRFRLC